MSTIVDVPKPPPIPLVTQCIFEPKIIDFDSKKRVNPKRWDLSNIDDGDLGSESPVSGLNSGWSRNVEPLF